MLRTALKPRWLALLVVVLAAATGMAFLGQWQLDRAAESGTERRIDTSPARVVPLTDLLRARQSFTQGVADRAVHADGRWDGAHQVLVAGRELDGTSGFWVLTPLVLADGSAVPVVRGWTPRADDPAVSPDRAGTGPVRIVGVLRPSEPPVNRGPGESAGLPDGQLDGVDLTQLVHRWPQKLVTGYVVLTEQTPAGAGGPTLVPATAPSNTDLAWRNLSYAAQWFVFAGFALVFWFRLVRDDHRGTLRPAPSTPTPDRGDRP